MRVTLLTLLVVARAAHADVGVVVAGEPMLQAPVMAQTQAWLQQRGHQLNAAPFALADQNSFIDCFVMEDMTCASNVFERSSKSTSVVYIRIDPFPGQQREYAFKAQWYVKGKPAVEEKRTCKPCDEAAMTKTLAELMTKLEQTSGHGKGTVKVIGGEPGIIVSIGERALGSTPLDVELPAGRYELTFARDGKVVATQHVTVEAGVNVELAMPVIAATTKIDPPERRPARTWPTLAVAGGVAAAIAGGVFLYYGSLGGPDEPYIYTNATKIGVPLAIAGGVGIAIGGLGFAGTF